MLKVRPAKSEELNQVVDFYNHLIDLMQDSEYLPGWEKDIYPTKSFLQDSIEARRLFVGQQEESGDAYAAAMVLNHDYADGYEKAPWHITAPRELVSVLHVLGVSPEYQRRGIATQMVLEAIRIARSQRQRVLRLDVMDTNLPAQKLYSRIGFQYVDTVELFYEDTGTMNFLLYDYEL